MRRCITGTDSGVLCFIFTFFGKFIYDTDLNCTELLTVASWGMTFALSP